MSHHTEMETRALMKAKDALADKGMFGAHMFDSGMTRPAEVVVVRAVIEALRDPTPAMVQAALTGGGAFEEQWRRAMDVASAQEET